MSQIIGIRLQVLTVKSAEVTMYTTWCTVKKLYIFRTQYIYVIVINTADWIVFIISMPLILHEVVTKFCISITVYMMCKSKKFVWTVYDFSFFK